jgi:hypothetical protein
LNELKGLPKLKKNGAAEILDTKKKKTREEPLSKIIGFLEKL